MLFALLHECAHIVCGHWRDGAVQVHADGSLGDPQVEEVVNRIAQSWIIPKGLDHAGRLNSVGVETGSAVAVSTHGRWRSVDLPRNGRPTAPE